MIAVDTSALMAIILNEPEADACAAALKQAERLLISAGTAAEAFVVASRRRLPEHIGRLIEGTGCEIMPVTAATARQVGTAYEQWGKGKHRAALNFGDCFAYALAKEHNCPLLYVGNDFSQTDIVGVL